MLFSNALKLPIYQEIPSRLYISNNGKTGFSLNVPIAETCTKRTVDCSSYCYGVTGGPIMFRQSLQRQYQNHARLEYLQRASKKELETEADLIYHHCYPQDFFRFFGVGDLTEGAVRVINALSKRHPSFQLWVSTRKVDLAKKLGRASNLHIMVSLDGSTLGKDFHETYDFVKAREPMAYAAYVQQKATETIPPWVKVVFAEHKGGRRAPFTEEKKGRDKRYCPATVVGGLEHEGACAECRYCFTAEKREKGRP